MKVRLLMVGKTREKWLQQGISKFTEKLVHYLPFEVTVLPDVKNAGKIKTPDLCKLEGESILKTVDKQDRLILLDENGKQMTSRGFSEFLEKQMMMGGRRLVFVIGGAYGFSEEVKARADVKVALSSMTFSHQMVRLIFAEQLYRAMTILKNEPYHND